MVPTVRARAALPTTKKGAMPMSLSDVSSVLGALAALATLVDIVLNRWPRHDEGKEGDAPTDGPEDEKEKSRRGNAGSLK